MLATGASPWMGISTTSQPRAKRTLYRACASRGARAEHQSKTTGSRPWLLLFRRSAATGERICSHGWRGLRRFELAANYANFANVSAISVIGG